MSKVNGRQPSEGKSSHCLWQGELKNNFLCFSKQVKTFLTGKYKSYERLFSVLIVTDKRNIYTTFFL
jgi:hypothetical protein